MDRVVRSLMVVAIAAMVAAPLLARADDLGGIRKEYLASLDEAGSKLIELAGAIPASKYTWRPNKEVRSIAEVLLHVTAANFLQPTFYGGPAPENAPVSGSTGATFEKSTTDKAKIVQMLKDSFAWQDRYIRGVSDAELDQQVTLFGTPMSKRSAMLELVNHAHEHLGQTIAYARSNGVVPPWTAREKKAAAETAKRKADATTASKNGTK